MLTCTTIVEEDKILVVVPVSLLDSNDDFEVYRVHNLPIPFNASDGVMSGSVASYQLEAEAIAVNTQLTNFVLLTQGELEGCSKASIGFCSIVVVVPSAPLLSSDEEPMDVDTPPRPNPGHCLSPDSSGAVVPTPLRRCQNRGSEQYIRLA